MRPAVSRARSKKNLNWSVERRYEFIEFRLYWQGRINRGDLMQAFGISQQQASKDLTAYIDGRKSNLVYDRQLRTYVRGKNFKPRYLTPDATEYFAQLQAVEKGLVSEEQSWISQFPGYGATPTPARGVAADTLRDVLECIRDHQAFEVQYQSLSRPEPTWRWFEPHSLAHDGFRWHARAFCQKDNIFKDFLLSRVIEVGERRDASASIEDDADWNTEITLEIAPHPALSDMQRHVIALDYGMEDGLAKIKVRKALLYYTLKRLGLDTDPNVRKPQDQQITLLNRNEVVGD